MKFEEIGKKVIIEINNDKIYRDIIIAVGENRSINSMCREKKIGKLKLYSKLYILSIIGVIEKNNFNNYFLTDLGEKMRSIFLKAQ